MVTFTNSTPINDADIEANLIAGTFSQFLSDADLDVGYEFAVAWTWWVEWDISGLPSIAEIQTVNFLYHGKERRAGVEIWLGHATHELNGGSGRENYDPQPDDYYVGTVFPIVGTNKGLDLGSPAVSDVRAHMASGYDYFGICCAANPSTDDYGTAIYAQESGPTPSPTLQIIYTLPPLYGKVKQSGVTEVWKALPVSGNEPFRVHREGATYAFQLVASDSGDATAWRVRHDNITWAVKAS